ncbi:rRNA maturation RNase YbeY [Hyphococcus sp.]|uniref:rRNA maturation RNase YbeY n=1 Tax=Hyphococcus sp. TaxID=2038636 RepID=UPI003CCBDAAF
MIETIIEDDAWRDALPDAQEIAARCQTAAAAFEPETMREIAVLWCDDAVIANLNAKFRNKAGATNVLSFPSGAAAGFLGDIALARETCMREAVEKDIALRDHAAHLIIHAMLHLVGYDHETDNDAMVMEAREREILASMHIADPYDANG